MSPPGRPKGACFERQRAASPVSPRGRSEVGVTSAPGRRKRESLRAQREGHPARRIAAALLLAAGSSAASACALDLLDAAGSARLAREPLPAGGDFALVYTHSVTLRPVESRYVVRANVIVQTAEIFDEHGPGMSTEALPGERLEKAGGAYVLHMARPIPRLVVRRHERAAFRLVVGPRTIALDDWQPPSIELRPDCEAVNESAARPDLAPAALRRTPLSGSAARHDLGPLAAIS